MFRKVANEDLITSGWQRYLAFTLLSSREILYSSTFCDDANVQYGSQ